MFDDPKKELRALENQLLAAEEPKQQPIPDPEDEFQSIYAEVLAEFGPDGAEDEPPIRNFANGYGKNIHRPVQKPVETFESEPPAPREHSGFLTFLFCLECLAIAGVALFWLVKSL